VPTLAVAFLKSQEKYQDSFNEILDSRIRIWFFLKSQEPGVVEGILKGIFFKVGSWNGELP
jgi:hypothetical protein